VTRRQLAEITGLTEATLRSYVSYGEIPPPNVRVRVIEGGWTADVVLAWLEERRGRQFRRRGPVPRQPSERDLENLRWMARNP
jgi:predicted DNA-binding transcriptional regulator AlpA